MDLGFLVSMKTGGSGRTRATQCHRVTVSQGEVGVITTGGQSGIQGALAHPALGWSRVMDRPPGRHWPCVIQAVVSEGAPPSAALPCWAVAAADASLVPFPRWAAAGTLPVSPQAQSKVSPATVRQQPR